jgi:prepilin signal peptidase PulO-like enzyme (type II secretory pathway)
MITVILFVFGLIIGSFLNVVGLRFRSGVGLGGRSFCVVCRKDLEWWELVPVVSFVSLKGKCSKCKTGISCQYPLVELLTALVFATLPRISIISYILFATVFSIYIVILIYDARHKIIPDSLVYPTIALAFLARIFAGGMFEKDFVVALGLFAFFAALYIFSRGRAMGFGDAKLALSIGFLLGAAEGLSAVVLAFWIGTLTVFAIFLSVPKKFTMKTEIPFAPCLILGAWLALILHLDLFHVTLF